MKHLYFHYIVSEYIKHCLCQLKNDIYKVRNGVVVNSCGYRFFRINIAIKRGSHCTSYEMNDFSRLLINRLVCLEGILSQEVCTPFRYSWLIKFNFKGPPSLVSFGELTSTYSFCGIKSRTSQETSGEQ